MLGEAERVPGSPAGSEIFQRPGIFQTAYMRAQYCEERDEVLRSLDAEKFAAFWRKHELPMPPEGQWASPDVPLIMMHKARLQVTAMTAAEKEASRSWLISQGYGLEI